MTTLLTRPLLLALLLASASISRAEPSLLLQSTTSTANSGLYDFILPVFETETSIKVHVVAVGTGQAIRNARNCDADLLLVHAKSAEEKFVAEGYGVRRYDLMYNDFVIVGPENNPAKLKNTLPTIDALANISSTESLFVSRGDNSGTHKKELKLWDMAAIDTSPGNGKWYRETGSGMGATLNTAVGMGAYALTDRATWISFKNRQQHTILNQGDPELFNQYGIILVSPDKCPQVKSTEGQHFIEWITGSVGQKLIGAYKRQGEQLFYPNAEAR